MDRNSDNKVAVTRASVGRSLGWLSLDVAETVADRIFAQLKSYAGVPREALLSSVQRNLSRGVAVLVDGVAPSDLPEQAEGGTTTRQRLKQGARWEDIVRAYRMSLTAVHEIFLTEAAIAGLNPQHTLEGSSLLWELGDWFVNGSAEAFKTWSDEIARSRAAADAEFVRRLVVDDWQNPQFATQIQRAGFEADALYRVFNAPAESSVQRLGSAQHCKGDARRSAPIIVSAIIRNRRVGVIADVPTPESKTYPVAIGTPATLDHLSSSAKVAENIWALVGSKQAGTYDLSRVGWRVAVLQHPQVTDIFIERYITPLDPETEAGQTLIQSLKRLLQNDSNVRLTAQALQVHENSLRYRMERFSQKTGIKLDTLDHKIGLAWAIQAYEHQHASHTFGVSSKESTRTSDMTP